MNRRTVLKAGAVLAGAAALNLGFGGVAMALPTLPAGLVRRTLPSGRTYVYRDAAEGPRCWVGFHGAANTCLNLVGDFYKVPGDTSQNWQTYCASRGHHLLLGEQPSGKWNVGGSSYWTTIVDDVQYALDMVFDYQDNILGEPLTVDPWLAGFSNGASLAWRVLTEHGDMFMGAALGCSWATVYPVDPVKVYHWHGTGDASIPNRGGVGLYNMTYPNMREESFRAPLGSRIVHDLGSGGHTMPGWMGQYADVFANANM